MFAISVNAIETISENQGAIRFSAMVSPPTIADQLRCNSRWRSPASPEAHAADWSSVPEAQPQELAGHIVSCLKTARATIGGISYSGFGAWMAGRSSFCLIGVVTDVDFLLKQSITYGPCIKIRGYVR